MKQPGGALLDALIAATAARDGALLVTFNLGAFQMLASVLPARVESMVDFAKRL